MSGTILIVDDDEAICEVLQVMLDLKGYRSAVASNGSEALAWLRLNQVPCLILLDLMMPVMNGWQFVEQSRAEGFGSVPIVLMTAFQVDLQLGIKLPILRKPIDFDELMRTVLGCCQSSS